MDIQTIINQMMGAAGKVITGKKWDQAKVYAENEFKNFTNDLLLIKQLYDAGKITQDRAIAHVKFQKDSMETVLIAIEGLGILLVQDAINAALDAAKQTVNKSIGFALL